MSHFTPFLTRSLFLFLSVAALASCKKYEKGGSINKSEERLTAVTWELQRYTCDGANKTNSLLLTNYTEQFIESGSLLRGYNKDNRIVGDAGQWSLEEKSTSMQLSSLDALDFTQQILGISTSEVTITRLTKKELWYSFVGKDGHTHELQFAPL